MISHLLSRLYRITASYYISKSFISGKVQKLRLDSIFSSSPRQFMLVATSHRLCAIQIYFFSFALTLSTFFWTSVARTVTVWKQQEAYIPEGTTFAVKIKLWILSVMKLHNLPVCGIAKRVSKPFPCPDSPHPTKDVVPNLGDCLYHTSTHFVDQSIYIHTSTGYNDCYCI